MRISAPRRTDGEGAMLCASRREIFRGIRNSISASAIRISFSRPVACFTSRAIRGMPLPAESPAPHRKDVRRCGACRRKSRAGQDRARCSRGGRPHSRPLPATHFRQLGLRFRFHAANPVGHRQMQIQETMVSSITFKSCPRKSLRSEGSLAISVPGMRAALICAKGRIDCGSRPKRTIPATVGCSPDTRRQL